jgi:hypothetical protein
MHGTKPSHLYSIAYIGFNFRKADFESAASASSAIPALLRSNSSTWFCVDFNTSCSAQLTSGRCLSAQTVPYPKLSSPLKPSGRGSQVSQRPLHSPSHHPAYRIALIVRRQIYCANGRISNVRHSQPRGRCEPAVRANPLTALSFTPGDDRRPKSRPSSPEWRPPKRVNRSGRERAARPDPAPPVPAPLSRVSSVPFNVRKAQREMR